MDCPNCHVALGTERPTLDEGLVIERCDRCGGTWFDPGELDALDDSQWTQVEARFVPADEPTAARYACPRGCVDAAMYRERGTSLVPHVDSDDSTLLVHRCTQCRGYWLADGMLDRVRSLANRIDARLLGNWKLPVKKKR